MEHNSNHINRKDDFEKNNSSPSKKHRNMGGIVSGEVSPTKVTDRKSIVGRPIEIIESKLNR